MSKKITMECRWCGTKYTKSYKGYCSEFCYSANYLDRPRTIGRFYDESPDNVYDNVEKEGPYDYKNRRGVI